MTQINRLAPLGSPDASRAVADRGARYAIIGTIRPGSFCVEYADTGDKAEAAADNLRDHWGYYQVHIYPPVGGVDLAALGVARERAKHAFAEATEKLRAAVLRALADDRAEAEVARSARVTRKTVRQWAGK